ncbi:Tetratrico peptide repeat-containing protein [Klenkia marina]|uniref:Tetratrico peptide repeat-containing protein n=1 Tax=Klenkia marina TaxID=1960309 RepID=A0A1G4YMD1_9ACTN|nr:tetratricopeptide repeat protein [Klenkia marina]SCX54642.1 Tetratrico peptide repeat-containing protein [Klenkia marina]
MDWEQRVRDLWAGDTDAPGFVDRAAEVAAACPYGDGSGVFELAGAHDSTGAPAEAVELYREALARGLPESRRRQATVQLASSLRNLGDPAAGVELLVGELAVEDELSAAVRGFLALCLADAGREREAVGVALGALAPTVTRYRRSLTAYAAELAR